MEPGNGYAMTACACDFATSCRKVGGHWKRGNILNDIEAKARAVNIWLQAEVGTLCDKAVSVYAAFGRAELFPDSYLQKFSVLFKEQNIKWEILNGIQKKFDDSRRILRIRWNWKDEGKRNDFKPMLQICCSHWP